MKHVSCSDYNDDKDNSEEFNNMYVETMTHQILTIGFQKKKEEL